MHYLFIHNAKKILTDSLVWDFSVLEQPSLISNPQTSLLLNLFFSLRLFSDCGLIYLFIFLYPIPSLIPRTEETTWYSMAPVQKISTALIIGAQSPSLLCGVECWPAPHTLDTASAPHTPILCGTHPPGSGPDCVTSSCSSHPRGHHLQF